jgi:hypothetical protein
LQWKQASWCIISTVRTFVMGDPQAPFESVMAVLARHGLLGDDGRLVSDVLLISIGDHFDYDLDDPIGAGREGIRVLRWLAGHAPGQVAILLGNHDLARVMELATVDDARFAEARALGRDLARDKASAERRERDEFLPRFPEIPTHGLASRDYASFSTEQRGLVIELLLAGRFHLGLAGRLPDGRAVLLTHAGLTTRELGLLGLAAERDPHRLAQGLAARLRAAVEVRRADWEGGGSLPLSLEPLHVPGSAGEEGGGLLYHRPSCPDRLGADRAWELAPERPRRFDPRTLPDNLVQIAGHTGHRKCLAELGESWPTAAARARQQGGIRTLRVTADRVTYDLGVLAPLAAAADLILVDGEMRHVDAADYQLLELETVHLPLY